MFRPHFIVLSLIVVSISIVVLISRHKHKLDTKEPASNKTGKLISPSDDLRTLSINKEQKSHNIDQSPLIKLTKGKVLQYSLTGYVDLRFSLFEKPVHIADKYEILFSLKVIEKLDELYLLCIATQAYKLERTVEGERGPSTHYLDFKDFLQKPFCRPGSVVLKVSPRGIIQEVLIDNRFNDAQWIREGFHQYVAAVLGFMSLFPPLPQADDIKEYIAQIDYCGLVGFEHIIKPGKSANGKCLLKWEPRITTHLLGMIVSDPTLLDDIPTGESSGLYTSQTGFYEDIKHYIDSAKDKDCIKLNFYLKLINICDEPPTSIPFDKMARFSSLQQVWKLLNEMMQKASHLKEIPYLDKSNLVGLLREIDSLEKQIGSFSSEGLEQSDQDRQKTRELRRKEMQLTHDVAEMIGTNPDLLKDLEYFVKTNPLNESTLLDIMFILSTDKVKDLTGASDLALWILKNNPDREYLQDNGLFHLSSFQSDEVIQDLLSYKSENDSLNQTRDSSLANIFKRMIDRQEFEKGRRILDKFYLELQSQQQGLFSTLYLPFENDNDFVNKYIEDKWKNEFDKKTPLKIMVFRAYTDSQKSQEFRDIVEANLFQYFSIQEIRDFINVLPPRSGQKKSFLKFLIDKSPDNQLRSEVELELMALELLEKGKETQK